MAGNKLKIAKVLEVLSELTNYNQPCDELPSLKSPARLHHVHSLWETAARLQ